jgi:hypothetical protein
MQQHIAILLNITLYTSTQTISTQIHQINTSYINIRVSTRQLTHQTSTDASHQHQHQHTSTVISTSTHQHIDTIINTSTHHTTTHLSTHQHITGTTTSHPTSTQSSYTSHEHTKISNQHINHHIDTNQQQHQHINTTDQHIKITTSTPPHQHTNTNNIKPATLIHQSLLHRSFGEQCYLRKSRKGNRRGKTVMLPPKKQVSHTFKRSGVT